MSENKTKATKKSVDAYIKGLEPKRQADAIQLRELMEEMSGAPAVMWGESIVGFGSYSYETKSGRKGDWFPIGFSSRKPAMTIYLLCGLEQNQDLLDKLGPHKNGKSCLYVKSLDEVHMPTLKKLIKQALKAPMAAV